MPTVPSYKTELRFFHRGNLEGSLLTTEVFFFFLHSSKASIAATPTLSSLSLPAGLCFRSAIPIPSLFPLIPHRLHRTGTVQHSKHVAKPPSVQGPAVGQPDEVLHDDERRRRRSGAQDRLGYAEEESGYDVCCDVSFSSARAALLPAISAAGRPPPAVLFFCVCGYVLGCSSTGSILDDCGGSAAPARGLGIDLNFLPVDWAHWERLLD